VLLPLFQSVHKYDGEVVILVADFKGRWWFCNGDNYAASLLGAMTNYPIRLLGWPADLNNTSQGVECFSQISVGTPHNLCIYDEEGGLEARSEQKAGVRLRDFGNFLHRRFHFRDEDFAAGWECMEDKKPVLGFVQRLGTRKLTNLNECIRLAEAAGFRMMLIRFEELRPIKIIRTMRHLDVFVGVHGAAFTNLVFMRDSRLVLQVMPWGEYLRGDRRLLLRVGNEYKNIATVLNCTYMEYKVPVQDSSLYTQYPLNDLVLTDPWEVWKEKGIVEAMRLYPWKDVVIPAESFKPLVQKMYDISQMQRTS
jgi:hypothetical protein